MIVTIKDVRIALFKIRRRKGISSDKDITVTMIAKTIGCTRNTLYKKELDSIMLPFKKIKSNESNNSAPCGSVEYLKNQLANMTQEVESLKEALSKSRDWQIDQEILSSTIEDLEEDKERLQTSLDDSFDKEHVSRLARENAALRELILRAGLKTQI